VQTEVWQHYAIILHDYCRQSAGEDYQRAWVEVNDWLKKQVHRLVANRQEQEEVVQETLSELQDLLRQKPLQAPRAFFAYALQILRRKTIDLHRRRTAVKRGKNAVLSLEGIEESRSDDADITWEEKISADKEDQRGTERTVVDQEIRQQLLAFFHQHLTTELQRQVATAHFLDGLSPVEIAGLMGKQPHEIRLVKARVVQTLRGLPLDSRQVLLDILGKLTPEDSNDT
jgi:RNA polymerase sigma factor (sigma-70 family)